MFLKEVFIISIILVNIVNGAGINIIRGNSSSDFKALVYDSNSSVPIRLLDGSTSNIISAGDNVQTAVIFNSEMNVICGVFICQSVTPYVYGCYYNNTKKQVYFTNNANYNTSHSYNVYTYSENEIYGQENITIKIPSNLNYLNNITYNESVYTPQTSITIPLNNNELTPINFNLKTVTATFASGANNENITNVNYNSTNYQIPGTIQFTNNAVPELTVNAKPSPEITINYENTSEPVITNT